MLPDGTVPGTDVHPDSVRFQSITADGPAGGFENM
jgi:hypothetical protein